MPISSNWCPSCFKTFNNSADVTRHIKVSRCRENVRDGRHSTPQPSFLRSPSHHDAGDLHKNLEQTDSNEVTGLLDYVMEVDNDLGWAYLNNSEAASNGNHPTPTSHQPANLESCGQAEVESRAAVDYFEGAGKVYGKGEDTFSRLWTSGECASYRRANPYYPFSCFTDFEVGKWLVELGISQSKIDEFFKLKYVQDRPLSFDSSNALRKKVEQLPSPPCWKEAEVEVPGAKTQHPLKLFYRDALECFEYLFGNPVFNGKMEFVPQKVWQGDRAERLYSEMMTGDLVWDVQSKVSPGETLGLVILASDKTHLTNFQGDKECHAVYLTCGNIHKDLRRKATSRSWMLIGQIPIAKFMEDKEVAGMLAARLYHRCMDIILENMKRCSHTPKLIVDPAGDRRLVRTIAAALQADLPEMHTIACTSQRVSPVSTAEQADFGDGKQHKLRKGQSTLKEIDSLLSHTSPRNFIHFQKIAKEKGLNGVQEPFWRDWKFADPSVVLAPDALHQWHKFFANHPLKWAVSLLGKEEYDKRLSALQPHIGYRSFPRGVTKFKQHSLRETRDLECSLVAILQGHPRVELETLKAFRALKDFIYTAQYESQSTGTLKDMDKYIKIFHRHKKALSNAGVRDGMQKRGEFCIPKMELLMHVVQAIRMLGSAPQFSTEQSERAHITECKQPYKLTNHRSYQEQMCRRLDNLLRVHVVSQLVLWEECRKQAGLSSQEADLDPKENTCLTKQMSEKLRQKFLPQPVEDISMNEMAVRGDNSTWLLNFHFDHIHVKFDSVEPRYGAAQFQEELLKYLKDQHHHQPFEGFRMPFNELFIWWSVRVQLKDPQDESSPQPLQRISARPKTALKPACFNFVLVNGASKLGIYGIVGDHFAAQLRMVFVACNKHSKERSEPLAYVHVLIPGDKSVKSIEGERQFCPDAGTEMFRVRRRCLRGGERVGTVVALKDIWRPVELVPRFGKRCPPEWTCDTAVEEAEEFHINPFCDKITYQHVY
ncbi:hypothetical protein ACEPAF_315 [Sanghuangporus sanghuang]